MKIAFFGTKPHDKMFFNQENTKFHHEIVYFNVPLNSTTAPLTKGFEGVCAFVNDNLDKVCLKKLSKHGVKTIALRSAGFNNVDIDAANSFDITVVRVADYSPHSVAEHAVALVLALNRKIYRAYNRVRENNFLLEGLLGFNLNDKVVGVIGTGKIGSVFCEIMKGFGCTVLAYDPLPNTDFSVQGIEYVDLQQLFKKSDVISLHCPLTPESHHLINDHTLSCMKDGVMLINTSRGSLIDTAAIIKNLKSQKIGYLGLDVYEEESDLFFKDISNDILEDDKFARLLTFPNVLITGHQAFFTKEALENIASTTLQNLAHIEKGIGSNGLAVNMVR